MDIKRLDGDVSVSAQIGVDDMETVAALGFRSIVCNRPDGEAVDQPLFEEIRASAEKNGLQCVYLPVISGNVTDDDVNRFAQMLHEIPAPVLAYCRTGTRSVILWSLANSGRLELPQIIAVTHNAGYDMSALAARIADAANSPGKVPGAVVEDGNSAAAA